MSRLLDRVPCASALTISLAALLYSSSASAQGPPPPLPNCFRVSLSEYEKNAKLTTLSGHYSSNYVGGTRYYWYCPPYVPPGSLPETIAEASAGATMALYFGLLDSKTGEVNIIDGSDGGFDPNQRLGTNAKGTGAIAAVSVEVPVTPIGSSSGASSTTQAVSRYAAERPNKADAIFPIKAPPPHESPPFAVISVDASIYGFLGGEGKTTGIPGGPFGTATGGDQFTVKNNVMFTGGAIISFPQWWNIGVTGGLAELNQTVKWSCSTYCAVAPATPAFTTSEDNWVTGGYVGGRIRVPAAFSMLPAGTQIGLDYKHVFFGHYDVSLGNIATRLVQLQNTPDMDIVTATLTIPLH